MRLQFFFTFTILTGIFFITPYISFANTQMQGEDNFIQLDQVEPDNLPQITPYQASNEKNKGVKIVYSQSDLKTNGFKFSFTPMSIDYGEISPTNPIIRTNKLSIVNKDMIKYAVFLYQNNPLRLDNGNFIPSTSCDNGVCTAQRAGPWTNTLSFGLGYRCDSKIDDVCQKDFSSSNFYRQFPDEENITDVLTGTPGNSTIEAIITYKVNTASAQPLGNYRNSIYYIAVPEY